MDGGRKLGRRKDKENFDSLILLNIWMVWRERNNRAFEKIAKPTDVFIDHIKQEAKQWKIACTSRDMYHD